MSDYDRPWSNYDEYTKHMKQLWQPVLDLMVKMGVPRADLDYNGAGSLITVYGEDPQEYWWIGAAETDAEGPWLETHREGLEWVGSARYKYIDPDDPNWEYWYSDVVWGDVPGDSMDDYAMAEALVAVWRASIDAELVHEG